MTYHRIAQKKKKLAHSDYEICYWCGRKTTQSVSLVSHNITLETHTDHIIPFVYSMSNASNNLIHTCSFCNSHKSAFVFESEIDVRKYLAEKWYEKTNEVFTMLTDLRSQADMAEVLLKGMSYESLARDKNFRMSTMRIQGKAQYCQECGKRKAPKAKWPIDDILACSKECLERLLED